MTHPLVRITVELSALLAETDQTEWAATFDRLGRRAEVETQEPQIDQGFVRSILHLFGGMGSFNDLVLSRNRVMLRDENNRLDALRRQLFEAARAELR
jgi:hypothetical protein